MRPAAAVAAADVFQVTDCHGQSSTAQVDLTFVQAVVANDDSFTYYASPYTAAAATGLLNNDVVPGACAGQPSTFALVTPPTKGGVVVR
jgi:hypothetical protein